MQSLYKYLPSQYTTGVLRHGKLLFRNLTYFRQHEGKVRGDPCEGIHKFSPDKPSSIHTLSTGIIRIDNYNFLNSTNSDLIFAFCLSKRLSRELMIEFNCDACIEIFDPQEFIRRVRFKLARLISVSIHSYGLIAQPVKYYNPLEMPEFDYTKPTNIIFAKEMHYKKQEEFRLAFGKKGAFKRIQQFTLPNYDPEYEASKGKKIEKLVQVGDLNDIAFVIKDF